MKTIRTGVYALLKYKENIVVILKKRGPFTGLYDLPGGKIEHGENHIFSLKRELEEEIGLLEKDFEIKRLLTVEEDFVKHIWEGEEKDEHIIAIVYEVNIITENLNLNFIENGGDSAGLRLISINDLNFPKTNILQKALNRKNGGKVEYDILLLELCEIYGWSWQELLETPPYIIDLALSKMSVKREIENKKSTK